MSDHDYKIKIPHRFGEWRIPEDVSVKDCGLVREDDEYTDDEDANRKSIKDGWTGRVVE